MLKLLEVEIHTHLDSERTGIDTIVDATTDLRINTIILGNSEHVGCTDVNTTAQEFIPSLE